MKPYSTESPRYIAITNAVARMIATDFQPFSVVEDEDFLLSWISDTSYPVANHFRISFQECIRRLGRR